jgi:hypothetical protein
VNARWEAVKWQVVEQSVARGNRAMQRVGRAWKVRYKGGPTDYSSAWKQR